MLHKDSGGYVMKNWPAGQSLAWASDELCAEFDKDMEEMEAQEAAKDSGTEKYEFTNKPMEYELWMWGWDNLRVRREGKA